MHGTGIAVVLKLGGAERLSLLRALPSMTGRRAYAGRSRLVFYCSHCSRRAEGTLHGEPKVYTAGTQQMERTGDEAPQQNLRWKKLLRLCCRCHGPQLIPIGNTLMGCINCAWGMEPYDTRDELRK